MLAYAHNATAFTSRQVEKVAGHAAAHEHASTTCNNLRPKTYGSEQSNETPLFAIKACFASNLPETVMHGPDVHVLPVDAGAGTHVSAMAMVERDECRVGLLVSVRT